MAGWPGREIRSEYAENEQCEWGEGEGRVRQCAAQGGVSEHSEEGPRAREQRRGHRELTGRKHCRGAGELGARRGSAATVRS